LKIVLACLIGSVVLAGCGTGATPSASSDAATASNVPPATNTKAGAGQAQGTFALTPEQAAAHLGSKGK
jgi:hypothetical protein